MFPPVILAQRELQQQDVQISSSVNDSTAIPNAATDGMFAPTTTTATTHLGSLQQPVESTLPAAEDPAVLGRNNGFVPPPPPPQQHMYKAHADYMSGASPSAAPSATPSHVQQLWPGHAGMIPNPYINPFFLPNGSNSVPTATVPNLGTYQNGPSGASVGTSGVPGMPNTTGGGSGPASQLQQSDYYTMVAANVMMAAAAAAAVGNRNPTNSGHSMFLPPGALAAAHANAGGFANQALLASLGLHQPLGGIHSQLGVDGLNALLHASSSSGTNSTGAKNQSGKSKKGSKKQSHKRRRKRQEDREDEEEDTYATSSSMSDSDGEDDLEDGVDHFRKARKTKRHHRRRAGEEEGDSTSSGSKNASPPTRYVTERPRRSTSGGNSSAPSVALASTASTVGGTMDAAAEEAMFAEYNGEQRLQIDFDDLGTITIPPERLGKKGLIPDGLCGSFMMYSERWYFSVKFLDDLHNKTSTNTTTASSLEAAGEEAGNKQPEEPLPQQTRLPTVLMHRCIEWKVRNESWEGFHIIAETQEDALRRNTRGVTLCNKVFTEAMEMRAKEFQRLLVEEKSKPEPDPFQVSFFENRMNSFRPKRFSEGPLLFGLRHKVVQRRAYIMAEEL